MVPPFVAIRFEVPVLTVHPMYMMRTFVFDLYIEFLWVSSRIPGSQCESGDVFLSGQAFKSCKMISADKHSR